MFQIEMKEIVPICFRKKKPIRSGDCDCGDPRFDPQAFRELCLLLLPYPSRPAAMSLASLSESFEPMQVNNWYFILTA